MRFTKNGGKVELAKTEREKNPCRMGIPLALESAGGYLCIIRHEFNGNGTGKCEKHCPQHIPIRKELLNAKKELEGPVYKLAKKIVPRFMKL